MFFRFVLILLAIYLFFRVLEKRSRKGRQVYGNKSPGNDVLQACPGCDTYFAEAQGIKKAGQTFCSADCAKKDRS